MSESEDSMFYNPSPKEKQQKLVEVFKRVDAMEEREDDALLHDGLAWAKAMQRFMRLAWMPRKLLLPKKLTLGGVDYPPFSEQVNPSNRGSIPSCFNRFVRDHFAFASNRAAMMLIKDFDFFLQFDGFFCELAVLSGRGAFYDTRCAFERFIHQFKYYVSNTWIRHLGRRLQYQKIVKGLAEEFKKSFEPLARQLYEKEQNEPTPFIAPAYFDSVSGLSEECVFQKNVFFGPPLDKHLHDQLSAPAAVNRSTAAKICGVNYNTIKNWETKGPSPQAFDYPGRCNLIDLADFSNLYCDRLGVPRVADKFLKSVGLGSTLELRLQELKDLASQTKYAHLFEKKS